MVTIKIHSKRRDYPVILGDVLFEILNKELDENIRYFVVLDKHIESKFSKLIKDKNPNSIIYVAEGGEETKSFFCYQKLTSVLLEHNFTKNDMLIGFGGGSILDLVGYLSATYKRGIDFISIPTTTLAMVDASIGGKNGINVDGVKNALGTINPPLKVLIGLDVSNTLDQRNFNNGLFESLKMGLSLDKDLYDIFKEAGEKTYLKEVIYRSIMAKKEVVEKDEDETGLRKILNFGHTFGHAFESASNFALLHGEAVANGMLVVSKNKDYYADLLDILSRMSCPIVSSYNEENLINRIKNDKKADISSVDLIVVNTIGKAEIIPTKFNDLKGMVK